MTVLELCLLSWISLQAPAPQAPTQGIPPVEKAVEKAATSDPVGWLPPETLIAVGFRLTEGRGVNDLWNHLATLDPANGSADLGGDVSRMLAAFGLTTSDVEAIAQGGIAIGVTGVSMRGPEFVCVANLEKAGESLRKTLASAALGSRNGEQFVGGTYGDTLVFGSTNALIESTRAAMQPGTQKSLSTTPSYQTAAKNTTTETAPALTVFVRPDAAISALLGILPSAQQESASQFAEAMGLATLDHAMLRVSIGQDQIETVGSCPTPPPGTPLASLFGGGPELTTALAELVPANATRFSFSSFDLADFVAKTLTAVEADPANSMVVTGMMGQFTQQTGLDLSADVLAALTGLWANVSVPTGEAVLIGVQDGAAFAALVKTMLDAAELPVQPRAVEGGTAYQMPMPGTSTGATFGVCGNWVCLTENPETFTALARQISKPTTHPGAALALENAGPKASMVFATADGTGGGVFEQDSETGRLVSHWTLQPVDTAPAAPALAKAAPTKQEPAPVEEVLALQDAENDPKQTNIQKLASLTKSTHGGVAARATWLLGKRDDPGAAPILAELVTNNAHAEVRAQAMKALLRIGKQPHFQTAVEALDDADIRVRTMAAKLLGRLQHPEAVSPLLAALSVRSGDAQESEPSPDINAMLLALVDMKSVDSLLPAAEALNTTAASGVGQALAYFFQSLSSRLAPQDEATLLVAVLDHSEPMLRRFAICRLGELRVPSTAGALEGRLASEGPELRPLVEVSLSHVRQQQPTVPGTLANADVPAPDENQWKRLVRRWNELPKQQKMIVGGIAGGAILMVVVLLVVLASRRRARRREEAVALTRPSEEAFDDGYDEEAEYDEDDGYVEDDDYVEDDGTDGEYVDDPDYVEGAEVDEGFLEGEEYQEVDPDPQLELTEAADRMMGPVEDEEAPAVGGSWLGQCDDEETLEGGDTPVEEPAYHEDDHDRH